MSEQTGGVLPPNSPEAEEAILGSVLLNPDELDDVRDLLTPDDFFIVRNGWVWEAICAIYDRDDQVDYVTVVDELRARGKLSEIGGAAQITYLINHTPASLYAGAYAALVERTAFRRLAQDTARELHMQAQGGGDIHDLRQYIDDAFVRLIERSPGDDAMLRGRDALTYYADVLKARTQEDAPDLLSLPWESFARQVPGIKPGKVVLVSGFSGQGKTLFLEGLADWWAMLGHRVFYITTELTREDMLDRMVCRHTGIPYIEVASKTADAQKVMRRFASEVAGWLPNIDYWETNGADAQAIYAQIRRAIKHGRRIIFVDYLSEAVGFQTKGRELKDAIDGFFRTVHDLAKRTGADFFIASQQSPTDHGPRVFGSSIPNQKAALHVRLEMDKAKTSKLYTVDDRLITVREDEFDPMMRAVFEKNNFGPTTPDALLFRDGARYRFLDEGQVSATQGYQDSELDEIAARREKALRQPKQYALGAGEDSDDIPF